MSFNSKLLSFARITGVAATTAAVSFVSTVSTLAATGGSISNYSIPTQLTLNQDIPITWRFTNTTQTPAGLSCQINPINQNLNQGQDFYPALEGQTATAVTSTGITYNTTRAQGGMGWGSSGFEYINFNTGGSNAVVPFLQPGQHVDIQTKYRVAAGTDAGDQIMVKINCTLIDNGTHLEMVSTETKTLPVVASTGGTSTFPDVQTSIFKKHIEELAALQVVRGYDDNLYHPERVVTRDQMAAFIVKAFEIPIDQSCVQFPDVPTTSKFYQYIHTLKCKGIVDGYGDGTYRPGDIIRRDSVTKFIVKAMAVKGVQVDYTKTASFPDVTSDNKFRREIAYLSSVEVDGEKIIAGYSSGLFNPGFELKRDQMAKFINTSRKAMATLPKGAPIMPNAEQKLILTETADVKIYRPEYYTVTTGQISSFAFSAASQGAYGTGAGDNMGYQKDTIEDAQYLTLNESLCDELVDSMTADTDQIIESKFIQENGYQGCAYKVVSKVSAIDHYLHGKMFVKSNTLHHFIHLYAKNQSAENLEINGLAVDKFTIKSGVLGVTTPSLNECSTNKYNCTDFSSQSEAQKTYEYCVSKGKGDIHNLDADNNQIACENN